MYVEPWVLIAIAVVLTMLSGTFFACMILAVSFGFIGGVGGFFVGSIIALSLEPAQWWVAGLMFGFLGAKYGALGGLGAGLVLTVMTWLAPRG